MTKINTDLRTILSTEHSEQKFEELISWVMDVFGLPFEIQKKYSGKRRRKKYSRNRLLAEGSIYQPDNYTEKFGPRIIFELFLDCRTNEWFFFLTFQFDEQYPVDFSEKHRVSIPYLDDNKEFFKEFMKVGTKKSYARCVKNL